MNEVTTMPETQVGDALPATAIRAQVNLIQEVMKSVMRDGEHFGVIPGTPKPTLLKPGAEKLCLTFRLDPEYESVERFVGEHLFVKSKCTLYHSTSGRRLGSGEGSCSTKESKYAYRQGKRVCPKCGQDTIIKGKQEYGGGWLCFQKKGGCGAKWQAGADEIEKQSTERVPNEDLADQYNTVLKMANKRSLVAAVLNVTGASDIFTQDIEDMPEFVHPKQPEGAAPAARVEGDGLEGSAKAETPASPASQDAPPSPAFVWRLGKHKGKPITEVPTDYLAWALSTITKPELQDCQDAARMEIDRRQAQDVMQFEEGAH